METNKETVSPRLSRSKAPADFTLLAGVVRYKRSPPDFEERARRAYARFTSGELPTQQEAAAVEGLGFRKLSAWKKANETTEQVGEDGIKPSRPDTLSRQITRPFCGAYQNPSASLPTARLSGSSFSGISRIAEWTHKPPCNV